MAQPPVTSVLGAAQIQSVATGATTQNATQIPAELAGLPSGSLLKGFIINRDRSGNPILRTDRGDVLVKSEVFLKTGSEVVIRINHQQNQSHARIVSVNDVPLKEFLASQQTPIEDDVVMQSSMSSSAKSSATSGSTQGSTNITLDALMLKPVGKTSQAYQLMTSILKIPPSTIQAMEQGAVLQFKLVSSDIQIKPQTAQQATVQNTTQPNSLSAMKYQAYAQTGQAKAPAAQPATTTTQTAQQATVQNTTQPNSSQPLGNRTVNTQPYNANPATATVNSGNSPTTTQTAQTTQPSITTNAAPAGAIVAGSQTASTAAVPPIANAEAANTLASTIKMDSAPPPQQPVTLPPTPTAINSQQTAEITADAQIRSGTMTVKVIGSEADGSSIVRTPIGTFKIFTASPPPVGSTLKLELATLPTQTAPTTTSGGSTPVNTSTPLNTFFSLSHDWHSMREAMTALQADPISMVEMNNRVPNTKSKMVNSILFFLSALKSGDIKHWLGGRSRAQLNDQSPNLLNRLSAEFSALRTASFDQPDEPWQMFLLPIMHDEELNQARLFVHDDAQQNKHKQGGGTRFVLEVSLSELGEMQLDGFIRKQNQKTAFDLVVRTHKPLSQIMQDDITNLFTMAAEATGYTGQVRFQADPASFISPLELNKEAKKSDSSSIIA